MLPSIPVDFNNRDEDGAVRLTTRGTLRWLEECSLPLTGGQSVCITDDELTVDAVVEVRSGYWVAMIVRYL